MRINPVILIGAVIMIGGILMQMGVKLGRLPGDIHIRTGNTTIFVPITTAIIASILISILFWVFRD